MRKQFKRMLAYMLAVVMCTCTITALNGETVKAYSAIVSGREGNITLSGLSESYLNKVSSFLSDSRWRHGTSWGSRGPKISSWGSSGCCAYAADFCKYVFGVDSPNGKTQHTSINNIQSGDVLYFSQYPHYVVVLQRTGNTLITAESNVGSGRGVRVSNSTYTISGNSIYQFGSFYSSTVRVGHYEQCEELIKNAPTNVKITSDKTKLYQGEVITFKSSADNVEYYSIGIDCNGERILTQQVGTNFSYKCNRIGKYTAYVSAANAYGFTDSNHVDFKVEPAAPPTNVKITSDKTKLHQGEVITFKSSADNVEYYSIGIDCNGERILTQQVGTNFSYKCNRIGKYTAYVSAANAYGFTDSNHVDFKVEPAAPPTNVKITSDKTKLHQGEVITFKSSADNVEYYSIGIDCNGERILTQQVSNDFSYQCNRIGEYTAYVSAANAYGFTDSNFITFMVIAQDDSMSDPSTCDHICHKGGISKVFYKIALFFWKIFKINKTCDCGVNHY